ncbi:putative glucuronoxylan glucuronosyltransferase F8H-like protein [Trifolium pratense]|uniref:Putative glucuronoxylan glucuronosyltransferase F8H-like protein n=1 Tax=Trifolium pratense TaxID=57577 RepID=A0A2K3KZ84_TRIPR|nr:putative glucuronoxylan glucuronosyltransferase F8H-like protein [Trifolium pratense]
MQIALFVSSNDALKSGWLLKYLRDIRPAHIKDMQQNLAKYSRHFLFSSPAQPLGPEDLVWKMVWEVKWNYLVDAMSFGP